MNESTIKRILSSYIPRQFNSNEIEDMLLSSESKITVFLRQKETKKAYENFDSDLSTFLDKVPDTPMKKYVSSLLARKLLFFGSSKMEGGIPAISRLLITRDDKLAGVVINNLYVNISLATGRTNEIEEVAYGAYAGLIRAAFLLRKKEIRRDKALNKSLSTYLYFLILKVLGRSITLDSTQKGLLQLLVTYLYYKQFLEMKHSSVISVIEREYVGKDISKELYERYKDVLEKLISFKAMKDIAKLISVNKITSVEPGTILMTMIKLFEKTGFYAIIGGLDSFAAAVILSRYPTELISPNMSINSSISKNIEDIVSLYIKSIHYADEFANATVDIDD